MSPLNIIVAAAVLAVLLLATCAIVAIHRWWDGVNAERAAAVRRIEAIRGEVRGGVRHGRGFTLDPPAAPRGKATHVSSPGERSENRG